MLATSCSTGHLLRRGSSCTSCAHWSIRSLGFAQRRACTQVSAQAVAVEQDVDTSAGARLLSKVKALKHKKAAPAPKSPQLQEQQAPFPPPSQAIKVVVPSTGEAAPLSRLLSLQQTAVEDVTADSPAAASRATGGAAPPAKKVLAETPVVVAERELQPARENVPRASSRGPSTSRKGSEAKHNFDLQTGMAVAWLGTSSGAPTKERNVSSILLRVPDAVYIVDCGEGTRRQMQQLDFDASLVNGVFITHLHGDHCFGAASLLLHLDVAKRSADLPAERMCNSIVGPPGIASLLRASLGITGLVRELQLPLVITELVVDLKDAHGPTPLMANGTAPHVTVRRLAAVPITDDPTLVASMRALDKEQPQLPSIWQSRGPGRYHFIAEPGVYWDLPTGPRMHVRSAQLQHRVACWGYVFTEMLPTGPGGAAEDGRKVVLLGDTVSSRCMAPLAYGADLISHEATFQEGMEDKARIAQHSTGWMAGMFANAMHTRMLVLTHFSSRYYVDERRPLKVRSAAEEEDQAVVEQRSAISQLIREARKEFPDGEIHAARDFHVQHVPVAEEGGSRARQLADTRLRLSYEGSIL